MDRGVLNIDLFVYCVMLPQGESPLRRRQGGLSGRPLDPFGVHYPHVSGLLFLLVSIPLNWANDAKTRKKVDKKQKNTRKTLDIAY